MMRRILIFVIAFSFMVPYSLLMAQETQQLTVAGWSFDVIGAVKAPTITGVIHLGALEDGRDWLAVSLIVTNTSNEQQELHSDRIQLQTGDELIKQTGAESEAAAKEIDFRTIGGSSKHKIEAGDTWHVIQVYKVAPGASDFTLVFDDFQGKWELSISDLVETADGDPRVLLDESSVPAINATPSSQQEVWRVSTASFDLTLIGAAVAPTFSGPFHLGMLDDGRSWLVVTYEVQNTTGDTVDFESESVRIISAGKEVKQAGDESRSVAGELNLVAPSVKLKPGESIIVVQVFKIDPADTDNSLKIIARGDWFLNLRPVLDATDGDGATVVPISALDLAQIEIGDTPPSAVPTVVPTPTPEPTPVPTQTPIPTVTPVPTITPIPTATIPPPPPTSKAQPAYYVVVEEEFQDVARPRWVIRIVIPEGSQQQIVAACADAVDSYLSIGPANVVVVFGYDSYGSYDGAFTRCRAEGTRDGLGHTGNGKINMFNSEDDGRIQVQTVSGELFYVPRD